MPNIKSSAKRDSLQKKQHLRNKAYRSALKTSLKKLDVVIAEGDRDAALAAYKATVKNIDRAVTKGLLHRNNAARKKSRLSREIKNLAAAN